MAARPAAGAGAVARRADSGYHLEQAVAERRVLGVADEHDAELAVRAGEHLAAAGLRAVWRYDVAAAANLLSRAYELLPAENPQRRIVMQRLAEAYQVVGRLSDAESALTTMLREAEDEDDLRLAQIARLELMRSKLFSGPDPIKLHSIHEETGRALDAFREPPDEAGLALAYYVRAYVHFRAAEMHEMEQAARQALAHADRSARLREAMAARMPRSVGGGRRSDSGSGGDSRVRAARRGRGSRAPGGPVFARDPARDARQDRRCSGSSRPCAGSWYWNGCVERSPLMVLALDRASVELSAGDVVAAERQLEDALGACRAGRLRDAISRTAARLSLVVLQRDPARAEALATLSRDNAPAESIAYSGARASGNGAGRRRAARVLKRPISGWKPFASCRLRCRTSAQPSWWSWPRFSGQAETRPGRRDRSARRSISMNGRATSSAPLERGSLRVPPEGALPRTSANGAA